MDDDIARDDANGGSAPETPYRSNVSNVSPPESEVVRTAHWLFSRRGPAFLDWLVRLSDHSLKRIDPYLTVGQTTLDLGCGWGHYSLELSRKVGPTGRVYAVDLANKCIDSINRKSPRRGLVNIVARRSTAADVGFIPDATVDLVFANGLLCSMATDRDSAVEEIKRVMKPSGHAYISLGMAPPWGYVDRSEWSRILSGFKLIEGGDFRQRWALVSKR